MQTIAQRIVTHGDDSKNNFTIIRLFAAIAVIYGHSFLMAKPCGECKDVFLNLTGYRYAGDIALYIFFVLSGFLITASLHKNRSYGKFLGARFKRIFPAFAVFIFLTAFVIGPIFTTISATEYFKDPRTWSYVLQNISFREYVYSVPGAFEQARRSTVMTGTTWSLWVEVRLYILSCVIACLGATRSVAMGNGFIFMLVAWAIMWPGTFPLVGGNTDNMTLAAFYGVGALAYINRESVPLTVIALLPLGIAAAASFGRPEYDIMAGLFLSYATLSLGFTDKIYLPKYVQDYSYGIYLYGWPVQQILNIWFPDLGPYGQTAVAVPIAIALGAASWFLIEKPIMGFHRRSKPQALPLAPGRVKA